MSILPELTAKFRVIWAHLDERTRRLNAAAEAKALGYGGVTLVHRACGLSRKAIRKGIQQIEAGITFEGRIRRPGGGRKPITESNPQLVHRLEATDASRPFLYRYLYYFTVSRSGCCELLR